MKHSPSVSSATSICPAPSAPAGAAAPSPAVVEATSQVSRFHLETLEVTSKTSLQLQTVNISVNDKQLLSDAVLQLQGGVRYGLIGRNGVGKSILLRVLGNKTLVGFPKWLTCMHVEQEVAGCATETAVQMVLAADVKAAQVQSNIDLLEAAMDSSGDEQQLAAAVSTLQQQTANSRAAAANATAAHRSGRRGVAARKAAVAAEQSAAATSAASATMTPEAAAAAAQEMLTGLYEQLAELDVDVAEGRARQILAGLGFTVDMMAAPTAALSGGWRMRVALACALFAAPDILCLDEPTNHLDLEAILWLQEYLTTCCEDQTLLIVSHDRAFLNAVCEETIELKNQQLRYFAGPYDAYAAAKTAAGICSGRQAVALDKQRKHMEASIQAAEKQARQAGDDKKLLQVASRKKKLEERLGLDKNVKGHKFKLNRDLIGYFESRRPQVVLEQQDKPFDFKWPQPAGIRAGGPLLQLRSVGYTYPGESAPVLQDVTLDITTTSRIALVGPNGAGKTTLLKLLSGELKPNAPPLGFTRPEATKKPAAATTKKQQKAAKGLAVDSSSLRSAQAAAAAAAAGGAAAAGSVERAAALKVGQFGQHCIEELQLEQSALDRLKEMHPGLFAREQDARDYLGSFGLGGRPSMQPLYCLSGGQKARAALALLLAGRPQLLILDEPTNHLDLDTVEALVRAIQRYEGAVVVASHDVRFVADVVGQQGASDGGLLQNISGGAVMAAKGAAGSASSVDVFNGSSVGEVYVVGKGAISRWDSPGGMQAYAEKVLAKVLKEQGEMLTTPRLIGRQ